MEKYNNYSFEELYRMLREVNSYNGALEYLEVYTMDEFDDLMAYMTPTEIAQRMFFGDFNPNHDFYGFNGYGNLVSYSERECEDELRENARDIIDEYKDIYFLL